MYASLVELLDCLSISKQIYFMSGRVWLNVSIVLGILQLVCKMKKIFHK